MKPLHPDSTEPTPFDGAPFKPLRLIAFVLILLLGISFWLKWYTGAVSIPRYCGNRAETLGYLELILTEARPSKDHDRKPYIIAAKLIYLVPRKSDEPIPIYLHRVGAYIEQQCQ